MSDSDSDGEEGPSTFPLHNAAQAGNVDLLRQLLTPPPTKPEVAAEELAGLDDILARYAAEAAAPQLPDVDLRDYQECTALHVALLHGQLEAARVLLEHGASLEVGCEGSPPLHVAICVAAHGGIKKNFALLATSLLLQFGADPYDRDDNGRTGLHWAAQMDFTAAADVLLEAAGKKREQLRAEHQHQQAAAAAAAAAAATAGGGAAAAGGPPAALPAAAADEDDSLPPPLVIFQDKQGCTALHLAARQGHAGAMAQLLSAAAAGDDSGAEASAALVRTKNKAGQNAVHSAVLAGSSRCAALLVAAAPESAGVKSKLGMSPADLAAKRHLAELEAALRSAQPVEALEKLAAQEAASKKQQQPRTLLVAPPECLFHFTCPAPITRETSDSAPPENVERLNVLTKPGWGILKCEEFEGALRWDEGSKRAAIGDVLRVHDWNYVRKIQAVCDALPDDPEAIGHLDGDTAVSRGTFAAALAAAGAVCTAVDEVVDGTAANAFCAVRPPGHHSGPLGVVSNANDPNGSHGFCLFNNAAIGAAYAMTVHRHAGIKRVAILDFDVHHGNGTEACVTNTIPSTASYKFATPYSEGVQSFAVWKPWLDSTDTQCIFFASVQGYGPKAPGYPSYVYPGSGATCDTKVLAAARAAEATAAVDAGGGGGGEQAQPQQQQASASPATAAAADGGSAMEVEGPDSPPLGKVLVDGVVMSAKLAAAAKREAGGGLDQEVEEDPDREFVYRGGQVPTLEGPRVIDVGIPGFGAKPALWRRSWRDKIIPALVNFKPDMIFVCAGFDAHKKDEINFRYIGVTERDYEWITEQVVAVANRCCQGRVVSVLEGGYRIQGGVMSAFARSVAAHVKCLAEPNASVWDAQEAKAEREHEKRVRAEAEAKKAEAAAQKALAREAYIKARLAAALVTAAAPAAAAPIGPAAVAAAPAPAAAPANQPPAAAAPVAVVPVQAAATTPAAASTPPAEDDDDATGRRKRRRGGSGVDYVALNKQLEEEAAARRGGAT
ncbi:hypothetical protein D9Q98_004480 [Chlorella vulgaris]|uniref:Histone deacetylase domain-containing protein n=1 Tax=Chlorella vulgaris TaxID=3077 RepID=A0A9D4TPQ3_CHLVU|nr:hypothetical protein D9Q98_004480 [Chlorella vulgaris]